LADNLSALSVICGILGAVFIRYEEEIKKYLTYILPKYPEDKLDVYNSINAVIKQCILPLLISSCIVTFLLVPVSINIIIMTCRFYIETGWSWELFNPNYYEFGAVMILVIQLLTFTLFLYMIRCYRTLKGIIKEFNKALERAS